MMGEPILDRLNKISAAIDALADDPGPEPESSNAVRAGLLAEADRLKALANAASDLQRERNAYKAACERAGVCMTCVVQAPEPYGCSDCLNTGWAQGEPVAPLARRAAASDGLLEALRMVRSDFGYCLPPDTLKEIDAAIAKAGSLA
ncbi:hypothetical protein GJ654_10270 [Rhodoblastus acidophilus]|uniref:Uncharacterized protein n=1 Tax=Rhodoblastus acidophilus TaxID=1074 RepID=A0A6N8DM06_RHOAC|nr:hypothetical protein [Rhodoblastus acidophilus]MCW2275109.1 hypothetical protein [Rhodoblastus acidophilus]MTV31378.1 hypothetical protein [Rhodoblastus acidophilus]